MSDYIKQIGTQSETKEVEFLDKDGVMVPRTVDFLSNVEKTFTDLIQDKGYKQAVLCLSFDSGQGKMLVTGKLADLEGRFYSSPLYQQHLDSHLDSLDYQNYL